MSNEYETEHAALLLSMGRKLREVRVNAGFSQDELARVARVHRTFISQLERGRQEPRLGSLLILAEAIGVPLADITCGLSAPAERRESRVKGREPRRETKT